MRPLVIVRPEPGASTTARAAAAMGIGTLVLPLFEIRSTEWTLSEGADFDGLLLTSANAIRQGGGRLAKLKDLPAYCVGEATAAAAREAGFSIAEVGSGGVDDLLQGLPADLKLLHPSGKDRRPPAAASQSIHPMPVYEAVERSQDFGDISGAVVALHSPRAATAFASQPGLEKASLSIVAISPNTADAAGTGWQQVEVASEPTDAALLAIAFRLCNKQR